MTNLETLKQQTADMEAKIKELKAEIDRLENGWEMECPYEEGDKVFKLGDDGLIWEYVWDYMGIDESRFEQGNIFPTRQAARLEAERRNLLIRFRAFRDECNNGWKPDWNEHNSKKWVITKNEEGMYAMWTIGLNGFSYFGCFKNQTDCERAIELFGDKIKELVCGL